MSVTTYNRLFSGRIVHSFYEDGFSKTDIGIQPSAESQTAMRNYNLLFKHTPGSFNVFYKVKENGAPVLPVSNLNLVFELTLLNKTSFSNFTNLNAGAKTYSSGKLLYFTNKNTETTNDLSYSLLDGLMPKLFSFEFPQTATNSTDSGKIIITNSAGQVVTPTGTGTPASDGILPTNTNKFVYAVDLRLLPSGVYTFETRVNNANAQNTVLFIDNELSKKEIFGIVNINIIDTSNSSFPDEVSSSVPAITDKRIYDVRFISRATQWKYYVLFKTGAYASSISIGIADLGGSQLPYNTSNLAFTTAGSLADINGIEARVITSSRTDIPFFEVPKKNLKLVLNPGLTQTVIADHLSGPSGTQISAAAGNAGISEIFIYI